MTTPRAVLGLAERQALRSAAQWYARLSSGQGGAAEQARWQQWHNADPLHREAWQQVEAVQQMIARVPGELGAPVLQHTGETRRRVLQQLLMLAGFGVVGWNGWHSDWRASLMASYRTRVGEQRQVLLADGSRVLLDSQSALDVSFDNAQRVLHLLSGRVLVETAADPLGRPLRVDVAQGQVEALGTRFTVQVEAQFCEVAVLESAVLVRPAATAGSLRVNAGEQVRFDANALGQPWNSDITAASWRTGSLIAIERPLADLLDELARYRHGWLRCDPAVAGLKISGAFPLHDIDLALAALHSGFGLRIVRRTDYWVTVLPA